MHAPTQRRITAAQFKPTPEQVRAAETLLVAMAHEQLVRPIVEAYDAKIFAKHQFRIARKYVEQGEPDRVITNPKQAYLIADEDFATFDAERNAERDAARLKVADPGNCPLLEAEHVRRQAERALLLEMSTIPGMETFATASGMTLDLQRKAVDLTLRLLAPYVPNGPDILRRVAA